MSRILFILVIVSFSIVAEDEQFIFTESSFGPIELKEGMEISLFQLSKKFPYHKVSQTIGQGDSPDFHSFTVSTWEGEELVEFISYIEKPEDYEKAVVTLDEVITCSKLVKDQFGIRPLSKFNDALIARNDMKYGFGHMDNFIGKGKLWYLFAVENGQFSQGSRELAVKVNPSIECISWPYARWL